MGTKMTTNITAATWVYVLVKNPGVDETIVGQTDLEKDITFIPTFSDKESAQQGILHIPKEHGQKYEIQAIIFEDLERYAAHGQSLIFIIDADGNVIEKSTPGQNIS
jgi:hypothetical protein